MEVFTIVSYVVTLIWIKITRWCALDICVLEKSMKLEFCCRLAVLWCVCGLLMAGCEAEPVEQPTDQASRLDRSLHQAAESFEKRRDYATATSYYRNLYRRDQTDIGAVVGLSRGLRHLRQAREARAIILRALKETPKDRDLRAELGKVQLALGEPLKAIDTLSRVDAEIQGKRWDIKIALAIAYDRVGMYAQAERPYRLALKLSPENAVAMNNFALSLAQAGRLTEAVEILERAAALPEATSRMRQNLALLYAMKGDLTLAEQYVRRDMPPDIADQNMAYYRRLRAGMASGENAAPLPVGQAMAPIAMRAPGTPPPAEVVASVPVAGKPGDRALPNATATMVAAPSEADKAKAEQPKTAAPEKTAMAAPDKDPAPKPEPENAPEPMSEREPVVKPAGKDEGESVGARVPMPEAATELPVNATTSVEKTDAIETAETAKSADGEPLQDQTPETAAEAPAMKSAAARIIEPLPSSQVKLPDAGAKGSETTAASVAAVGYRLQLGSFRSMDGAETLRARLLKQHRDLLRGVELVVETVTVPDRGDFFRVNSRPMPDREMVDETCLRLAIRDVPCLLVRVP
jgi:Flp pilus assembly protein TadD